MTNELNIEPYVTATEKLLDFHFANTILKVYGSQENYLIAFNKFWHVVTNRDNAALQQHINLFSLNLQGIIPYKRVNGKLVRIVKDVINGVKNFRNVGKAQYITATGKKFSHPSFWIIDNLHLKEIFDNKLILDLDSDYYNDLERDMIYKFLKSRKGN